MNLFGYDLDNVAGCSEICYSAKMALWAGSRTRSKKTALKLHMLVPQHRGFDGLIWGSA